MVDQKTFLEFSRPFIEASKQVFETMVFTKLEHQKPFLKKDDISQGDISAVLGLTGKVTLDGIEKDYKAMLVIAWPYQTYFKTASAMLMETHTEYSSEIADVGGEIANMIMGNAKRNLSEMGYTTNMAIPSMIEGAKHTIKYPAGTTIIVIPVKSAHGNMFMEICYKSD